MSKIEDFSNMDYNFLETGDIILFSTKKWYSRLIEYFTSCPYSHVGIILKEPTWIDEKLTEKYYLLESGAEKFVDAETGKFKFGVQLAPFDKIFNQYKNLGYGRLYYRKLNTNQDLEEIKIKIKNAFLNIYDKYYDLNPFDWLVAYYELDKDLDSDDRLTKRYQKTNTFWCSALVSYIYVECGLLDKNLAWSLVSPSNYCSSYCNLPFINCKLEIDTLLT